MSPSGGSSKKQHPTDQKQVRNYETRGTKFKFKELNNSADYTDGEIKKWNFHTRKQQHSDSVILCI